ncbi:hypothetical protein DXG03_002905 [Asterophora parasitica]|uniref:RING-type domain-containing protein n=1 Tax=Asterophora parasitica TaxID=117018 RepID=A0A9P7KC93_9AGAR|nr:hypothetical protein DXG03_002905 [Asterophora parasitica]
MAHVLHLHDEVRNSMNEFIDALPVVNQGELDDEDSCPICLTSFSSIFMDPTGTGITKLACNHIFCRKDLTQWITSGHGNCPACRDFFLDIRLPSESDDESSDGGEYIPEEHEHGIEDGDDAWFDDDGFSDAAEYQSDDMDIDTFGEVGDMSDLADYTDDEVAWGFHTDDEGSSEIGGDYDAAMEFSEEPDDEVDLNEAGFGDVLAEEHETRDRVLTGLSKDREAEVMNQLGFGDVLAEEHGALQIQSKEHEVQVMNELGLGDVLIDERRAEEEQL